MARPRARAAESAAVVADGLGDEPGADAGFARLPFAVGADARGYALGRKTDRRPRGGRRIGEIRGS